jgi:hypothetical protein
MTVDRAKKQVGECQPVDLHFTNGSPGRQGKKSVILRERSDREDLGLYSNASREIASLFQSSQ